MSAIVNKRTALAWLAAWMTCLASAWCAGAVLSDAEKRDLLDQGNALFRQANELAASDPQAARDLYAQAVLRFERIVDEGDVHNGKLYYNIGNAYFRMDDLGRAILNYRRAQRYMPRDPNLRQNLAYARARRREQVAETAQRQALDSLLFGQAGLSVRIRAYAFATAFALFWTCLGVRLFRRHSGLTATALAAGLVAALLLASLLVGAAVERRRRPGVIVGAEVIARKGDSTSYEQSFTQPLHAGTEFTLVETRGAWVHIELGDGRQTWIPAATAELQ